MCSSDLDALIGVVSLIFSCVKEEDDAKEEDCMEEDCMEEDDDVKEDEVKEDDFALEDNYVKEDNLLVEEDDGRTFQRIFVPFQDYGIDY